jgi:aryl-alcohol dehydrogenase-like predicted oxidoreductase
MGRFMDEFHEPDVLSAVARLHDVAEAAGLDMSQLALAWVLRDQNVASAIVGATRPEQIAQNARASGVTLDAATLARIDEALEDVIRR